MDEDGEVFTPEDAPDDAPPPKKTEQKKKTPSPAPPDLPGYLTGKAPETPTYLYWVIGAGAAALVGYFIFTKVAK